MAKTNPKLLKPKPEKTPSHNAGLSALVEQAQRKETVPFQVLLDKDLAIRVKVFSAQSGRSHKQIVTEALTRYLDSFSGL